MENYKYIRTLSQIGIEDLPIVGGKNASLGELFCKLVPKGINIPDGFVITAAAYWDHLDKNDIKTKLENELQKLDVKEFTNLSKVGENCRKLFMKAVLSEELQKEIQAAYHHLKSRFKNEIQLAIRSSATAEDLPEASFAGQQESYLNIETYEELLEACIACYASLFTNRAIKYRTDNGFKHMDVALSIGVQKMVRSDKACAGVSFTLDIETGFREVVSINASWGLGENVVKGNVTPDEYVVFKPALKNKKSAIISRNLGAKEKTMTYVIPEKDVKLTFETKTINLNTEASKQQKFTLSDAEVEKIASWSMVIEDHYNQPMDIEWAKDGVDEELYIVQARPETVHAQRDTYKFFEYTLHNKGKVLIEGKNVGSRIASGKARILHSPKDIDQLQEGEILVTQITNPDWDPILKKASAIITDRGGITSHAAIVARETGAVAVVGTGNATGVIKDGQEITVSCIDGKNGVVYDGLLKWDAREIDTRNIVLPETKVMLILADPDQAFKLSFLPNNGVGLLRLEFAISHKIKIHPIALVDFKSLKNAEDKAEIERITKGYPKKEDYFIDQLSQAVATIAAAFYPKEVIVRMSDFKTNEYANLIGGKQFEPEEENPMLGWRGASRYYSEAYKEGFRLECETMKIVRNKMGFTNVKLMIPFCRTVEEGHKVIAIMEKFGLKQGANELEIYMMVEIPSNVILAEEFAEIFDGFSIGSNDLTQLTLGIERDSEILAPLFDAENDAVKRSIENVVKVAAEASIEIGLCGQAPSDSPKFAAFLVKCGIDSISFNPDALIKGIGTINYVESQVKEELNAI